MNFAIEPVRQHCVLIFLSLVVGAQASAQSKESWECSLDLHQGDTGTLSFARQGSAISGATYVERGDHKHQINGSWQGNKITFRRTLGGNSVQDFDGIAITINDREVRMGGRFAARYNGVWSANCGLVRQTVDVSGGVKRPPVPVRPADPLQPERPVEPTSAGPALNMRATPYEPTERDKLQFSVEASHSQGVESIEIFVNGQSAKRCRSKNCVFSGGPYRAGTINWYVIARSNNGGVNETRPSAITIGSVTVVGNCSISGRATGSKASSSDAFFVSLSGPNSNAYRDSTAFRSNRYSFTGLPEGRYYLSVDTRGDLPVRVSPANRTVDCRTSGVTDANFEFR